VPVSLHVAVREKRIRFHLLDAEENVRLRRKLVRPTDDVEVPSDDQVRGYEIAPDQYVIVTDEELESVRPESRRSIDIEDFVSLDEIDPIYYERTYYLAPDEHGAKPYRLLAEAMKRSGKVAIGRFVLHQREYLAALRPLDGVLALETMHFADEIASADEIVAPAEAEVQDREMKAALQLIEAMSSKFDPARYHDTYREAVRQMIDAKVAGREIVTEAQAEEQPGEIIDLLAELQKSIASKRKTTKKKKAG
jgi:DNA end-binding protein Ku